MWYPEEASVKYNGSISKINQVKYSGKAANILCNTWKRLYVLYLNYLILALYSYFTLFTFVKKLVYIKYDSELLHK